MTRVTPPAAPPDIGAGGVEAEMSLDRQAFGRRILVAPRHIVTTVSPTTAAQYVA